MFYLLVHDDKELSNYYFKECDDAESLYARYTNGREDEKEESYKRIEQKANEGDIDAKKYLLSMNTSISRLSEKYHHITDLILSNISSDPVVQFFEGIKYIQSLDYDNGKLYLNFSAEQNHPDAVFFKYLLKFHGHCYKKKREKSLEKLLNVSEKLGGRCAFEVGMILLQGVHVTQNTKKGKEMIDIAESSGYKVPKAIKKELYYTKTNSHYYELLAIEYKTYFDYNKVEYEDAIELNEPIVSNPVFQAEYGTIAFDKGDYEVAEHWLKLSVDQDNLGAEFIYSLVCKQNESFCHLLMAAKGGDEAAQVLLGLYYIYGINHEVDSEKGIYWLEISAQQEHSAALLMLSTLYYFGFQNVLKDKEKYLYYFEHFKSVVRIKGVGIDVYSKTEIDKIIKNHGDDLFHFLKPEYIDLYKT